MLAAGLLLIVLSSNWRNRVIAPGPLTRAHAQLMQNGVSQGATDTNCAACHGAAERAVAGWSASLIAGHGEGASQPALCMECHDKTISTEFALAAHGLPPDVLKVITGKRDVDSSAAKELACAACHREHRGAKFDLTSMNDAACQSCHKHQFESFATDHPDFGAWPYERRTRIVFNHASHRAKHFTDKKQSFDCRSCHLDDATGQAQLLASYEVACAACHDDKIATSVSQGVPVLTLPTLDIDAMKAAGQDVGAWPELTTGDFDGRLPPMMKLLLAADPTAAKAIASLGVEFEFFDVDPDDPQQLEACALLAKAMRELLADLARRGPVVARERLAVTLGRDITDAEISGLMAGLPAETARGALRTWFPAEEVDSEAWAKSLVSLGGLDPPYAKGGMLSTRSGVSMQTTNSSMPTPPRGEGMAPRSLALSPAGTWNNDDATLAIRYRPAGHADPVLTGWLQLLADTPNLAEKPLAMAMFKELSKPTAGGLCMSCHSVGQTADGALTINWRAYDRASEPRGFTKFSHGPHLMLPQLADCTSCHAINDKSDVAASYVDWNPRQFVSDFAPLSKHQCIQCHTTKAAGDSCQKCHNYHVEAIEGWRLKSISDCGLRTAD